MKISINKYEVDGEITLEKNIKIRGKMPIKVEPFIHQIKAFEFACNMFGIAGGGINDDTLRSVWQEDHEKAKPFKQE